MQKSLFPLGTIIITTSVNENFFMDYIMNLLKRHMRGDWGDIDDKSQNEEALEKGGKLLSAYKVKNIDGIEERLWIITETNRSCTTILRPEEY